MKKISVSISLVVLLMIFLICFMIGRSMATQDKDIKDSTEQNNVIQNVEETSRASATAEKEAKVEISNEFEAPEEIKREEKEAPERMLFPCGQVVLKEYSQNAIYSKTMDDWRAHTGIDYRAEIGDDVVNVYNGTVKNVYCDSLWGYSVEIVHDGGIISVYKNLDEDILVKIGDFVNKGQAIAKVGNSARVESKDDPHLHFEIWTENVPINPNSYIY